MITQGFSYKGSLTSNLEIEKFKRSFINEFLNRFAQKIYQYSMRAQLIFNYSSIKRILLNFPKTTNSYFTIGEPNLQASNNNESNTFITEIQKESLLITSQNLSKKKKKLLSDDGSKVINLWYLPHSLEILSFYKNLGGLKCYESLYKSLKIVCCLNDLINIFFANACLSIATPDSFKTDMNTKYLSAWENFGGLGSEFNDIQQEIETLKNPNDPQQVTELLEYKRKILLLKYECVFKYSIGPTFLRTETNSFYKV